MLAMNNYLLKRALFELNLKFKFANSFAQKQSKKQSKTNKETNKKNRKLIHTHDNKTNPRSEKVVDEETLHVIIT